MKSAVMTCYDVSMRTIIDLPDEQIRGLAELCEREHISRAEAVRRAVEALLANEAREHWSSSLDEFFGIWKDCAVDGVEYQRALRAEWDHRDPGV
jgi:Arc/MetJ-type ribon-helix-helix transcriptional regulator